MNAGISGRGYASQAWTRLVGAPSTSPARLRNFARDRFPVDDGPARLTPWPVTEADREATDTAVVSDLRRATGRYSQDKRFATLIRELSANKLFAKLWATGEVTAHGESQTTIEHPTVGPVTVDYTS